MIVVMNGTNSSKFWTIAREHEKLADAMHYAIGVAFVLIMLISTIGNGGVLYVFIRTRNLRTPNYFLVSALCLGDFLMSTLGMPMFITSCFFTRWILGRVGCLVYGTLMTFLGLSQITLLASIAFTRYRYVVNNCSIDTLVAKIVVIMCYLYAFIFSLAPLFGWSRPVVEPIGTSCGPNWAGTEPRDVSYNLTIFVLCFFVPLSIIIFSYFMIYLKIKRKRIHKKNDGYENHVTVTILLMIVAFLLSWSPYAALAMYVIITKNSTMHLALSSVPVVLAKTAPLWNPYIYFVRDTRFNKECKKMLPIFKKLGLFEIHRSEQHESHQMGDTSSTSVPLCEHEKQKTVADLQKARTF